MQKKILWQSKKRTGNCWGDITLMDLYCVSLAGRTSQSCHCCDVERHVKCLDVSHSEFTLNSIKTDEAIFKELVLAPEVAPAKAHINQRMRAPHLLKRLKRTKIEITMKVLYSYVARN